MMKNTKAELAAELASARKFAQVVLFNRDIKSGGYASPCETPICTLKATALLLALDKSLIGTPDYMGLAYWWADEYKHGLREASARERKKAHDAIVAAGLPLDGVSDLHVKFIAKATNNCRRACSKMGCDWKPYNSR
jgi:hypothetical protein